MPGIIAFNNYLASATVFSEDTATGFPIANAVDGPTSTTAGFESGATRSCIFNLGAAMAISAVGITRSNLAANSGTITFSGSSSSGGTYTDFATITPAEDVVILDTLDAVSWQYVRVSVSGHADDCYISGIYVGDYVAMPCNVDSSFSPPEYCDNDDVVSNLTYTNELAGIIVMRKPKDAMFKFDAIEPEWMTQNWLNFTASVKLRPFYWVWKTGKPAFYCWPDKNTGTPKYSQGGKYFSVNFKVVGITQ